eukprot:827406-Prymnesium_polylepis.1
MASVPIAEKSCERCQLIRWSGETVLGTHSSSSSTTWFAALASQIIRACAGEPCSSGSRQSAKNGASHPCLTHARCFHIRCSRKPWSLRVAP